MAGDWLKVRTRLFEDPAPLSMASKLKLDVDSIVGKLIRAWAWAGELTVTGRLRRVGLADLDAVIRCEGFGKAMESVGWLKVDGEDLVFPKWGRHNSSTSKSRALAAQRMWRRRARGRDADSATGRAPRADSREEPERQRAAESREEPERKKEQSRGAEGREEARREKRQSREGQSGGADRDAAAARGDNRSKLSPPQAAIAERLTWLLDRRGQPMYDRATSEAIARHPNASDFQLEWALHRLKEQRSSPKPPESEPAYLRVLIEQNKAPSSWVTAYRKRQLEEFERKQRERSSEGSGAAGNAPSPRQHSGAPNRRTGDAAAPPPGASANGARPPHDPRSRTGDVAEPPSDTPRMPRADGVTSGQGDGDHGVPRAAPPQPGPDVRGEADPRAAEPGGPPPSGGPEPEGGGGV